MIQCQCKDCTETHGETYAEQFRHGTEVTEVLRRFPKPEQITAYLEGVEKMRGSVAMNRLRDDLRKEWKRK